MAEKLAIEPQAGPARSVQMQDWRRGSPGLAASGKIKPTGTGEFVMRSTTHAPHASAAPTVVEAILSALERTGVSLVFTVPGGPLMPFLRACKQRRFGKVVIARHETAACIMAASYFQDSGLPAVVALTSGPGAANAANGVLHALREQAALIVVSARPASHKLARGAVQDLDSARFFAPITKRSEQLLNPVQVEFLAPELIRLARAPSPGPVNLTVCADQWDSSVMGEA